MLQEEFRKHHCSHMTLESVRSPMHLVVRTLWSILIVKVNVCRKLKDTIGKCAAPRIGWQIDPFGHSRESASMMARMGFDALFFGRADWRDKTQREETKSVEMVWEASANLGGYLESYIQTQYVLYRRYGRCK